ncbi:pseudouridine synthase [Tepiditoga spiralis]|uniref:Pseudouridine synthase n=1 Tax=Tepiditoga spiralis TaxID=2108365 RepID=A0A7G1G7J5_9BACT|nr:RluA family pseudouridine synthase [Tepiditoga spiralis]BBE29992.1 pseudouridine synthase [Tepiditoga spiralis]
MLKQLIVDEKNYYKRLDKFIRNNLSEIKLGAIYKSFRKGNIKVNGKRIKKNDYEIKIGDIISIYYNEKNEDIIRPEKPEMKARPLKFDIIYENNDFIVINKPPKVSMHPGTGEQMVTIIEGLQYYAKNSNNPFEPHLVHRLDKLTSGTLVIAKNKMVSRDLSSLISGRKADKYYKTLVFGKLKPKGTLNSLINEKNAKLTYSLIDELNLPEGTFSYIDVHLLTGRKHQIRVQFSNIGHPIIGDDLYGNKEINKIFRKKYGLKRFFLHAYNLKFDYKNKKYDFYAPLYSDLEKVFENIKRIK